MRRIYLCLVHNRTRFASALLRVLGRVCAELYVACGALCTVTSASIQGAPSRDPSKPPIIGSDDDAHTPTGAHMFLILLPTGYFYDRLPNDARRGPTLSSRAAMLGMAPAVVCEGTGHLDPLLLCDRFYHADDPRRAYAAEEEQATYNAALKEASAVMAHACGSDAMDFQAARTQEALRHDPRRRISPFYRLVTKLYPIGVEEAINGDADCAWELYPPPPPLPGSEDAVPPHYYRVLTPVYRRDDGRVYNGVDLLHILEKRGGIEFVPGTRPPPDDERIFLSAMRRLPPDAATKAPPPGVHDALQRSFAPFAEAVRKDASSDGDGVERPEDARWVSFFVPVTRVLEGDRGQPMESPRRVREQAMRMAHRLRHNRRTLAAFAVLEAFSLAVMHVRITVLVDSKSRPTW
jgi:hypothetical protein